MKIIFKNSILSIINFIKNIKYKKFFIIDNNIRKNYYSFLCRLGINNCNGCVIKNGEKNKNFLYVFYVLLKLLHFHFNKRSYIICIGGGVTGDISGMIASIYYRGIGFINIPTTLLSQIDSSIGGKNGVNTFLGKNLIGTFYLPKFIIICVVFFKTLEINEYILGYSEIIKVTILNSPRLLFLIFFLYNLNNSQYLYKIVKYAISAKLKIVSYDLYDHYYRQKLNLGHTLAHSIEAYSKFQIPHSKAVLMGLYLILLLSFLLGKLKLIYLLLIIILIKGYFPNIVYLINEYIPGVKLFIQNDKKIISNNTINILLIYKLGKVLIKTYNINIFYNFITILLTN